MAYVIDVESPNHPTERYELEGSHFVGRATSGTIAIRSAHVGRRHARFQEEAGGVTIADCGSSNGTYVNGELIAGPVPFGPGDVATIADRTLRLVAAGEPLVAPFRGRTPDEAALLAKLPHDEHAREVYRDWLAEHGYAHEAEALALERELDGNEDTLRYRHRIESAATDPAWRALVMRPRIENCDEARCPGTWGSLSLTDDAAVRRCETCARDVHFALSPESAARHLERARPIVFDPALRRRRGDAQLEPPTWGEHVASAPASPLDLPLFKRRHPPIRLMSLLVDLGVGPIRVRPVSVEHDELEGPWVLKLPIASSEPLTDLVDSVEVECDWTYRGRIPFSGVMSSCSHIGFRARFRRGASAIRTWLERRFGEPRIVRDWHLHERWQLRSEGDGCILGWSETLPDWALSPASREDALAFLRELAALMHEHAPAAAILAHAGRPPRGAGVVVEGPIATNDFLLGLAPSLPALDVLAALGVTEARAKVSESTRRYWMTTVASGEWQVDLTLGVRGAKPIVRAEERVTRVHLKPRA